VSPPDEIDPLELAALAARGGTDVARLVAECRRLRRALAEAAGPGPGQGGQGGQGSPGGRVGEPPAREPAREPARDLARDLAREMARDPGRDRAAGAALRRAEARADAAELDLERAHRLLDLSGVPREVREKGQRDPVELSLLGRLRLALDEGAEDDL
jgi:hypothetical protein